MEGDYVKITTREYNFLRDFKSGIENELTTEVAKYEDYNAWVYSKDNGQKELIRRLKSAEDELTDACKKLAIALKPKGKEKLTVNDIKKLSLWGFWKWKWL